MGLAVLGMALPLLPTTPFLLLAAFLFANASPRWHRWLVEHRTFGPYIAAFRDGKGLTRSQKIRMGLSVSVMLGISIWFSTPWFARAILLSIWIGCLGYLLVSKTAAADGRDRIA